MAKPDVQNLVIHLLLLLLLTSNSSSQSTAQPNAVERKALEKIRQDWGSPAALSSWSSGNWSGVNCTSTGQVTALSFPNFQIANPIPTSICSLNNLTYIDLSYNNLTGDFPMVLYNCSALQYLDLSNNEFTGGLPSNIDMLSSEMQHLNLSSNGFVGDVPSAIGGFPKLKSLLLDNNAFDGSYPGAAIGGLVQLETLTLASNPFKPGPIPDEFGKLKKLTMLWVSWMNLTGEIPIGLSNLTELKLLDLSQNKMQGAIPVWVWNLQKLEKLYLYANYFTGGISPNITAINIQELDLSANELSGPIPETIANMKNLSLLSLYYNNLVGQIPTALAMLLNLVNIRLFNNMLSGPLPSEFGKHSELGNFEVSDNDLSGELPATLCFNHKLFNLVVFNNNFSGVFPANLENCTALENIMLHNNSFVGEFPKKIWSLPKLTTAMIQDNKIIGTFPSKVSSAITKIEMGNNGFSGDIPSTAVALKNFKAENNQFSGALPTNMSAFTNLNELNLAGNRLSGSIPPSIQALQTLNYLNLSNNHISGEIPVEIGSLPVLNSLDLSMNDLTGEIPLQLNSLHLSGLNLSSNQLTGEIPESLQNPAYNGGFLGNRGLCATVNMNMNLPKCDNGGHGRLSANLIILFSVLAGVVFICAVATGCLTIRQQKLRKLQDHTVWKMTQFRALDFTERDILNKLREENVIGSGGAGKVYRVDVPGRVGAGMAVAVKRLWNKAKSEAKLDKEFDAEVRILGDIRHINIVGLLCCISSDDTKLLVYEYMENGSLDRWLHHRDRPGAPAPLDWPTRLAVAIDAARGLSYMHHECAQPIMHRDVKSSNILLDPGFRAKIADFGLARILVKSGEPESLSAFGGTFGYIAPEYGSRGKVNEKVDVYSFGVVLLELATGRVANDGGAEWCLVEWAWRRYKVGGALYDAVDGDIQDRTFVEDAVAVFLLGVFCTGDDPTSRPSMKEVVEQLARYDRTYSVANSCREDFPVAGVLPAAKKGGNGKSLPDTGVWDGDDDSCCSFEAHPV